MDEYSDYNCINIDISNNKWSKMQKLINSNDSKVVLISVPKGFNITNLNTLKIEDK